MKKVLFSTQKNFKNFQSNFFHLQKTSKTHLSPSFKSIYLRNQKNNKKITTLVCEFNDNGSPPKTENSSMHAHTQSVIRYFVTRNRA